MVALEGIYVCDHQPLGSVLKLLIALLPRTSAPSIPQFWGTLKLVCKPPSLGVGGFRGF
jgi:hypothetical protein